MAETMFRIHDKIFQVLPGSPSDVAQVTEHMAVKHAYALLLVKVNPDGTDEEFNLATTNNLDALRKLKGGNVRRDLEECKEDFFQRSGLVTMQSTEPLRNLTSVLLTLPENERNIIKSLITGQVEEFQKSNSELNSIPPELSQVGDDISETQT